MVDRIRELLDIRQLSPTQFADLIGVGRPVISHILSERNKPSLEVVQKVISAFPDISLTWLMSGAGPMLTGATPAATSPITLPISTSPIASVAAITPVAQVQSAAPVAAGPAQVALPSAAPTPIAPVPAAAAAPAPLVAAFAPPVAQPSRLPQPPKFRPAQAAPYSESPAPASAFAPAPLPSPVAAPLVATPPTTPDPIISELEALPSVGVPVVPPVLSVPAPPTVMEVPPAVPVYLASIESVPVAPAAIPAPAPGSVSSAEALSPTAPNPAAAFSFLGEAGKTIRRIVLFYSDGSFSDYRPEGQ